MRIFGLIGKKLTHSFSKKYFTEKFEREQIKQVVYELFEIPSIDDFPQLIENQENLKGLNVTIPYKLEVLPFLHEIDPAAERVGAVNVIKIQENKKLKGYNSDYYGFKISLEKFLAGNTEVKALILGTGGASKAVKVVLEDLNIPYRYVSRNSEKPDILTYNQLNEDFFSSHQLIINTTPLGMYPLIETCPEIPYHLLGENHYLYDLVYNPENTLFMQKGAENGANVKNGLEMLYLQAEKSWEIWNE
ncbi:shikimate dehydrogenase family protein [Thermoflexibacter ruber]|uniref:Shikimate dehydrogenase n=1 Tax=Thermoflexibacter ruber TaxID=1003 RepID=A0A1I2IB83_9BACT|nr:shikimate dehydrogenase [Thermoflexibacter ruber]SFF38913.1 shikimate dehydrogenase [Thermoflexibacter ruber]